jgi:prophage antirepressor-like protein
MKLLGKEIFEGNTVRFYSVGTDIYIPRNDFAKTLKYACTDCLSKLHSRNKEFLSLYSFLVSIPDARNHFQNTTVYSLEGVLRICSISKQPLANKFYYWFIHKNFQKKKHLKEVI